VTRWPLRRRLWKRLHDIINQLARRYASDDAPEWGKALRIDEGKLPWRLNAWAARGWVHWWVDEGRKGPDT
jgi:hypothetical protein